MTEKDFANMTTKQLKEHCKRLQEELEKAQWFLRNKRIADSHKSA